MLAPCYGPGQCWPRPGNNFADWTLNIREYFGSNSSYIWMSRIALLRRLAGLGWGAGATTLRTATLLSPGPFNSRVLRSCLVSQCSHPRHWSFHQRRLANCDWMPASDTNEEPSYPRRHPTCWIRRKGTTLFLARRATEPGYLLSSAFTCPANRSQIETPVCVPRTTAHQFTWQQQQKCGTLGGSPVECGVVGQHYETRYFYPRRRQPPSEMAQWSSQKQRGFGLTASAPVSDVSAPCTNGVWVLLRPVGVVQKTKLSTVLSSNV